MKSKLFVLFSLLLISPLLAQNIPAVSLTVQEGSGKGELATSLKILLLFTILALLPAILMMMTSFLRIIISFHFLRQALGVQGTPPNQVIVGMTLFLTLFIMMPVFQKIDRIALQPLNQGKISDLEALKLASGPIKEFMLLNTREKDLQLFYQLSKKERPANRSEIDFFVLMPAFILSELKTAFIIGFLIYLPFLIIDVVVASVLVSLGMIFLPPIMVSLPFKIILFVLADGWTMLIGSLVKSFAVR